MSSKRTLAVFFSAALFYFLFIWSGRFTLNEQLAFSLFDDAMISMRYARNLADGHGLVWNAGEAPVEGYSNFLWTLWMALLHLIGISENLVSLGVSLTGTVLLLVTGWFTGRSASALFPSLPGAALAAGVLTLFSYPLLFWTLRGMEVGLITALVAIATWQSLQLKAGNGNLFRLAATLAILPLVRDDATVACLMIALVTASEAPGQKRSKVFLVLLCSFVLPFLLHLAGRKLYYGEWLPNTYYLKMVGLSLGERLRAGASALYLTACFHLWPILLASLFAAKEVSRFRLPWALVAGQAAYSLYAGGDAWEWMLYSNRYLAVATPALGLLLIAGLEKFIAIAKPEKWASLFVCVGLALKGLVFLGAKRGFLFTIPSHSASGLVAVGLALHLSLRLRRQKTIPPAWAVPVALVIFALTQWRPFADWKTNGGAHVADDAKSSRLGLALRQCTAPEAKVAVIWAGAVPYFSRRPAIDLLGKSDPVISRLKPQGSRVGHNKWNYEYSVGTLKPDVVLFGVLDPVSPEMEQRMTDWGYRRLWGELYVKPSPAVDACLGVPWRNVSALAP